MRQFFLIIVFSFLWVSAYTQTSPDADSTGGIFGIACSIVGAPQKGMMRTCRLANNANRSELHKLIQSDNVQNKIHGYIGLYFMQRNGYELTEDEKKMMAYVKLIEAEVEYCEGCIFGLREKLNKLITPKRLKNYYSWYSNFGYRGSK
jgi:hypothetical protein